MLWISLHVFLRVKALASCRNRTPIPTLILHLRPVRWVLTDHQSLSISDVELGFKSVTETSSNNYRLRRIIEANDSLKDVMHKFFLLRENSLVLDQSKSYYSDKDPHYSIICSDYYVFALRRILI